MRNSFVLLAGFALVVFSAHARTSRSIDEAAIWMPAFEHASQNGLEGAFSDLAERWILSQSRNKKVHLAIIETYVKQKKRNLLNRYVARVWNAHSCAPFDAARALVGIAGEGSNEAQSFVNQGPPRSKAFCDWVSETWQNDLHSILFFDSTASQLEEVRVLGEGGKCQRARQIMERVLRKEGDSVFLLEKLKSIAECLEDEAFRTSVAFRLRELEELRL